MDVIRNLFAQEKKQQPSSKFVTKISVASQSNLYVQVEPKDPTNCSNIVITAFSSEQVRTIIPIRVEWSRFKARTDSQHSVQKIHCLVGNTYMCEPGDVGAYIKAVVRPVEDPVRAEAEVVIGPIGIDVMMKRLIEGALYQDSLLSQVVICEKDRKNNVTVKLTSKEMIFTDDNSEQKLQKSYSMSEPKIELNPKDATRVYLRFQQDQIDEVRDWLNKIFHIRNTSMDDSSNSIKVPYKSHSQSSSKLKLFQKPERSSCINKMELRFISRNSRDLFLFTQRAFICREDMKNSVYIQRIQSLQNLSTEEDYYRFLGYMSFKNEIIRLADLAKQLEDDRDHKVKDLIAMEESIGEMTLTYLKIIEEKGKNQQIDFEQSYSQINLTREQMLNRKNVREIKKQNQNLKQRLREMNEQMQLLKFFKKEENQSMIFNQTSNPFAKKQQQDFSVSYQINASPEEKQDKRKGMLQMSMNYTKLLEQNDNLKKQLMGNKKKNLNLLDKSKDFNELLGDLEKEDVQQKISQFQTRIAVLMSENQDQKRIISDLQERSQPTFKNLNPSSSNRSMSIQSVANKSVMNYSAMNQSNLSSLPDMSMNQSMTSEAAMMKLQENLQALSKVNEKLQEDNTRLRRERDFFRSESTKLTSQNKDAQVNKMQQSNYTNFNDNSVLYRYQTENETLQNEKKALMKKLQSLSKENASGIREQFMQKDKKLRQYQQLVDRLKLENITMSKDLQQISIKNEETQFFLNQNIKLKKINSELLEQIKSLKIEMSLKDDNLYNSRVIEMQNQLDVFKGTPGSDMNGDNRRLLEQINELTKTNTKLKQQNSDKQIKLDHQAVTIEKMMRQSNKMDSSSSQKHGSSSSSTKERAYSQRCNQATVQQLQKYKREVKKLQQQIIFMKKSSDAINRSRDLTLEMDGYYEDKIDMMNKELQSVYHQNQNLSKMCERYSKDAREASKELNKWRQKAMDLMKAKTEESILLSNN